MSAELLTATFFVWKLYVHGSTYTGSSTSSLVHAISSLSVSGHSPPVPHYICARTGDRKSWTAYLTGCLITNSNQRW